MTQQQNPENTSKSNVAHPSLGKRTNTYKGKFPGRIKFISSRYNNQPRTLFITTNDGRHFTYEAFHKNAPLPKVGQDIEDWEFFIDPCPAIEEQEQQ